VLAWQCVLFGESPGQEIGLGGILYSIYCRVLHTATLALFLACLARVRNLQNTDILWRCKKNPHLDANYFPKRFQFVTPTDKREGVFSDNIQMILIKTKIHEDDLRSERGLPAIE